jgi:nucleotide-binding universal stress UspA family protein
VISRVLVPLDGLAEHDAAIPVALQLAARTGARPELVSVVEPGLASYNRAELNRIVAAYRGDASVLVLTGQDVEGQLIDEARRDGTLVCMASAGHGAIGEALLGSISAEIVRRSDRPVVLVGPQCSRELEGDELAIALDGSAYAEAILPHAIALADALGLESKLYLVSRTRASGAATRAEDYLARTASSAAPGRCLEYEVLAGRHADRMLAVLADRPYVALLAVTTHSARPLERLVGGSVALSLVHRVPIPVLVHHPTPPAAGLADEPGVAAANHG